MIEPPDPHIPAILLAVAAKLGFVVKARDTAFGDLGVLAEGSAEQPLYVVSAGGDRVAWSLTGGPRLDPHLLTRTAYEVLARGELRDDGSVAHKGKSYRLHWRWSASGMVAEAVATEASAA